MQRTHHEFRDHDLIAGDLALDFVNTVTARDTMPSDWLADFSAMLRWAKHTGAFTTAELSALAARALEDPASAAVALEQAKAQRESLNLATRALAGGCEPDPAILRAIEKRWRIATARAALVHQDGGLRLGWTVERSGLDLITHVVSAHAMALFGSEHIVRLRLCDGTDCGWYFLDFSKNGRRRWCDMATCGNLAKARRHQQRHRLPSGAN